MDDSGYCKSTYDSQDASLRTKSIRYPWTNAQFSVGNTSTLYIVQTVIVLQLFQDRNVVLGWQAITNRTERIPFK